ncbi:MAG TPA: hypothetical protein VGF99_21035, partial [Myxococcota bacterium]
MRSFVVVSTFASVVLTASTVFAAANERLLGFHPDGEVAYVASEDAALGKHVKVCRLSTSVMPDAWPPAVTVIEGQACAVLSDDAAGAPAADFARNAIGSAKTSKSSPWGITISVDVDGSTHRVKASSGKDADGGKTIEVATVTSAEPLKVGEILWRADGKAAAIVLEQAKKADKGSIAERRVVLADVSSLIAGSPAGRKLAQAKLKEADALLKKRNWSDAGRVLDEAIAADPSSAQARYQRAAADAQSGVGMSTMIEHLTWLKANADKNAQAKKLLDGAAKDKAFDAWAGEPDVRALIGLPAVKDMTPQARLSERGGVWTRQGATCKTPWLTMSFDKGDKGTLEVAESCKGKKTKAKQGFSWKAGANNKIVVVTAAKEVGGEKIPASAGIELDAVGQ